MELNRRLLSTLLLVSAIVVVVGYRLLRRPVIPAETLALGRLLADETTKLVGSSGKVVVVELKVAGENNDPARSPNVVAFKRYLSGAKVLAVEGLAIPSDAPPGPPRLSFAEYRDLAVKYPTADALVSFVGMPAFSDSDLAALLAHYPRLIALSDPTTDGPIQPKWFTRGVVGLVLVRQADGHYDSITRENVAK